MAKKTTRKKKTTVKRGRPTAYSKALIDEICFRIGSGESLRKICRSTKMPSRDTVCRWLAGKKEFSDQYAQAARVRALVHADDIMDIAFSDEYEAADKRVIIDSIQWHAARRCPRLYSDKVEVEHKGDMVQFVKLEDLRKTQEATG